MKTRLIKILYIAIIILGLSNLGFGQTTQTNYNDENSGLNDASIYYEYLTRNDLNVAFIQNFGLDHYTHINVTMIEANNNIAWKCLKKDFKIDTLNNIQKKSINAGYDVLQLITRDRKDPRLLLENEHLNWENGCYCIVSHKHHTLWIFHTKNREQIDLITRRFLRHSKIECIQK